MSLQLPDWYYNVEKVLEREAAASEMFAAYHVGNHNIYETAGKRYMAASGGGLPSFFESLGPEWNSFATNPHANDVTVKDGEVSLGWKDIGHL